jgi:peptidoglycan hydrolase CwlO-like protein
MTDMLTNTRREIDALLASLRSDLDAAAAARAAELDRREAELARSLELMSQDAAVAAAYKQGQSDEQRRMLTLIELQLEHLAPTSVARTVLHSLRRMVEGLQ